MMDMLTGAGLVLDIIAVVAVLIPVLAGFKQGFKRRLLALIALGVSALIAYVGSGMLAPKVYDSLLKDKTRQMCVKVTKNFDPVSAAKKSLEAQGVSLDEDYVREILSQTDENKIQAVRDAAEEYGIDAARAKELAEKFSDQLPEQAARALKEQAPQIAEALRSGAMTNEELAKAVRKVVKSPESAADYVEEKYAAPLVTAISEAVLFALIFALMQLIMILVFKLFGFDMKKKAASGGDRFAGVMLGLVCALANLLVMCIAITGFLKAGTSAFDIESVNSLIFLPIYNKLY
ncbi:MAG: hypothetical protein K6B74_04280 [Ruminococcus sp.]|nr:hypothetical protein [Ruminococcus sp.]